MKCPPPAQRERKGTKFCQLGQPLLIYHQYDQSEFVQPIFGKTFSIAETKSQRLTIDAKHSIAVARSVTDMHKAEKATMPKG